MIVCQIILKKNLYRAKNSGLHLTLSELKNQKLQKDWINLVKNFMSIKKRKLRESLDLGEKVLLVSEKIKKKSATRKFYQSSVQNISFFNKEKVFVISNKKIYRWKYILLAH